MRSLYLYLSGLLIILIAGYFIVDCSRKSQDDKKETAYRSTHVAVLDTVELRVRVERQFRDSLEQVKQANTALQIKNRLLYQQSKEKAVSSVISYEKDKNIGKADVAIADLKSQVRRGEEVIQGQRARITSDSLVIGSLHREIFAERTGKEKLSEQLTNAVNDLEKANRRKLKRFGFVAGVGGVMDLKQNPSPGVFLGYGFRF